MPGKVKVKIVAGRNLPVMDRSSDTTDAYVEIKLGNTTFKTDVCRKSLNPQWNSEWYRFEMDDAELQDEPLQIRLMDHDTYSANDAIGKVYLDLNPLLLPPQGTTVKTAFSDSVTSTNSLSGGNTMSGWFPVYDTMHGIRGEVNVIVKVELFSDFNKFRQSSCGVQFFNSSTIPHGYHANIVHGMVEELVVSDDPEYQWIDKIRTPRASNEARQTQFFKLSGEVQRKIGLKVLDFGGNAVIGYLQCFDLEAECGIVVRGLGTAVSLVRSQEPIHSLPCQYSEELNYNHNSANLRNPILNVVSASPLHKSPEPKQLKGFLLPGSPRNRRSKSPQVKQPFSEYKPKRLGTYSRSFSDNVPEYDNVSLKALFEQEDMRGEPVSNRKKIFERLSSFPKRKFRALRTNSGGSVSRRTPFVRSKSENVASVLIRSIMDPNAFLLARVPETEEISDSNKSFDSESIVHPLRYDDGHLVPISSSSSDISSSDIEDISDDISSNSTSTQDYSLLESDKGKHSKLNTSTSVDNSITSRNEDDLAERINTSTSFDNSITSKVDEGLVEKEDDSLNILKPNVFTSSVHVVITGDSDVEDNNQTQYSSFVKFKDSPSPPVKVRSIISNLKRQESFDTTFGIRKRSDTPPLSEMDPYMKFKPVEELNYSIGTLHKAKSAASLMVTQPSLDEDLKSRPVTNLSFPESVRNLPSVRIGHIPSCSYKTVHTVDFSGRNDSVRLSMGSAPSLCPEADKQDLNSTDPTLFKITTERNEINDILLNEKNKQPISFIPEHNINKSEVILKTENNPFEFPSKISSSKIKLIDKLSEYFETKLTTYRDDTLSTVQSANESIFNEITSSEQGEDFKKEEEKLDCFNSLLQNQTKDHSKTTSSESELSVNEVSNCEDITVIENSIEENINTLVEDFETIQLLKDKKDIVEENSEDSKNKKSDVWKNVDNDCKTDKMSAYKSEVKQNANEDSTSVVSRDSLLSTENGSLHETSKEFSQIVTVKENSPSHYIESLSVAGVKDKEKIGDLNHNNKVTNDKTLSNESEEIDKITSNAGDDKSLFIFGQKSSHVEELQECSEKDTVNEAVVPELTEERVTCAVSTSLDDNAPKVESPVDNDSTNQVCDTVTSNLSIPHLPLVKSLSASGLVEPCHSSVPPSRTVPEETAAGLPPASVKVSQSPVKLSTTPGIHRRSSDSDLSITPKGNSLTSSGDRSSVTGSGRAFQTICPKLALKKEPIEPMEFPFLTMNKFPPGFVVSIASTVVATSVKLSERISNLEEPESRDAWWMELRKEIRNHMRALSCNAVIGYSENSTICDDVCVLSATGTAAIVNVRPLVNPPTSDTPEPPVSATIPLPATKQLSNMASSLDRTEFEVPPLKPDSGGGKSRLPSDSTEQPESASPGCSLLHLPFKHASLPFPITTIKCGICKKQQVPDLMLATIEPPEGMSVIGRSGLVHAFVLRQKQHVRGEMNACTVSDHLPFIQFDVYKQLVNKLRVNGMNAVFGLKIQICLGEKVMAAVASGTGMCLEALPLPPTPNIKHGGYESKDYTAVMKALQENVKRNREFYQVNQTKATGTALEVEKNTGGEASDTEDSDNEKPDLDLNAGNKDVGLIVVDDEQDIEEVNQLLDSHPPEGFFVTATESLPGLDDLEVVRNLQMFTQILRMRNNSPSNQPPPPIHNDFDKILQGVYYKMRRMTPCALGNFKIRFALPESDDIQICIVGMALGLNDKVRKSVRRRTVGAASKPESAKKSDDGDLIFSLEEDQESSSAHTSKSVKPRSPARVKRQSTHMPPTDRYGVDITPLSYIPGGRIERYLGNLNFFFVRETSGIRESGGPSGFVHSFVAEVLAILRAHVTALGGNALAAFFLNECVILSNPQKNHGQCLINVGGDVVLVSYIV